ncbi:DUF397 domain-containing protein [Streptomyces sp. NPDC048717]|uniref:DUF397 domain-containing protein n=1 Tax=Streptomyces sp. NPDC048717 TaxID=3154928 RepID=UPI00341ED181
MTTEPRQWFKSSYSNPGGNCVEVSVDFVASRGIVPVRDSKDLAGPVLGISTPAFALFVAGVKGNGFDLV